MERQYDRWVWIRNAGIGVARWSLDLGVGTHVVRHCGSSQIRYRFVQEDSWEIVFTNMLELDWNRTGKSTRRQAAVDQLHEELVSIADSNISIRSTAASKRDSMTKFSLGLAAIAQEEDFDDANAITYQDALLAVDTLQNDPQLLRVISSMYNSIVTLQKRVDELEGNSNQE